MRGFTAILGSTLTTLGALVVIFFLNENERAYLIDFALVVIINLAVSLAVSLFFIPALITRLKLTNQSGKVYRKRKRLVSKFNYLYSEYIVKAHRWRWIMVILAIIAFGLPIFILPDSIKGDSLTANIYNRSLGSYFYKDNLKPFIDKWTGGSLRLFAQNSLNKFAGFQEATETVLFINISLPKGTNTLQMNELCMNLERYLAGFDGIQQYQTSINGPQYANITVYFTPKAQHSSIPFHVKAKMIEKAVEFNGADFYIYMKNDGFSNALQESWRGSRLELSGYNYRSLSNLAQTTVDSMIKNPRIQNIAIFSGEPGGRTPVTEEQINLEIDKSMFSANNTAYHQLYQVLLNRTVTPQLSGMIKQNGDYIPVRLVESQSQKMDLWQFMHTPFIVDSLMVKLANTAKISNVTTDGSIYKKDQSYIVTLAYDFVGPEELSQRVLKREVLKLNNKLPLGYKAAIHNYNYSGLFGNNPVNYWVIGLVILIIWGICAIIFESLIQPFAVICSIPLSFIGVFLTFYLFDVAFDQGGSAAFILLSGIVVNMSIYIFNDINHLRRNTNLNPMAIYMKAFNIKIVPILLSTIATILGLFPFILFDKGTVFWYNLAVGTVGGLIFSIPMLIIYLPLMVKITRNNGDIWPISKLNNTINSKTK